MNRHLDFLLSPMFDGLLHPEARADLGKSAIAHATIETHKIRTVPPTMYRALLGFDPRGVRHACLYPFPAVADGFLDYVKLKIFGDEIAEVRGDEIEERRERYRYNGGQRKYLVRRQAAPHLYIPIPTMPHALAGEAALWICEGMKKALALAQLDLPVVGIESAWGWHLKGSRELLPDFDAITLTGRTVKVVPDPDAQTDPEIARAMHRLAEALERRGARVQIVKLAVDEVAA
jgi:Domain of unknown function (DUF3854)